MRTHRLLLAALLVTAGSASAIDHVGTQPAAHMELKDGADTIVCSSYNTDPSAAPVATGCPAGNFNEQLFDVGWNQIAMTPVVIGGSAADCPAAFVEAWNTFSNPPYVEEFFEPGDFGGGSLTFVAPTEFGGRVILTVLAGGIYDGETGYLPPRASIVTVDAFGGARSNELWLTSPEVAACSALIGF